MDIAALNKMLGLLHAIDGLTELGHRSSNASHISVTNCNLRASFLSVLLTVQGRERIIRGRSNTACPGSLTARINEVTC